MNKRETRQIALERHGRIFYLEPYNLTKGDEMKKEQKGKNKMKKEQKGKNKMKKEQKGKNKMKIKLNKYYLDISEEVDAEKYKAIQQEAKKLGYKIFDCISTDHRSGFFSKMPIDQEIDLKHLFNNQYNTIEGFRVFDWYEAIHQNRKIKEGYYLTGNIDELNTLKAAHYVCEYCGNRHQGNDAPLVCTKCAGSEYLTEEYLPLTTMQPLTGPKRENTGISKEAFHAAQKAVKQAWEDGQQARLLKKASELKEKSQKEKDAIDYETSKRVEALEAGLDTKELIYYNHTDEWVLGWNNGVDQAVSEKWRSTELSFDVKIKHKDGTAA